MMQSSFAYTLHSQITDLSKFELISGLYINGTGPAC